MRLAALPVSLSIGALFLAANTAIADDFLFALTPSSDVRLFNANAPGAIIRTFTVTGLQTGEILEAIDFRISNGALYGVGRVGGVHRLYRIDTVTGLATQVGSSPYSGTLTGTSWGADVNPVVSNVLRAVSDAEENIRASADLGTLIASDTNLTGATSVVGLAYANNTPGATTTTAYVIDSATDRLGRLGGVDGVPSANGGVVTDIGALGVDTSADVGFDIADSGANYAALTVASVSGLYTINLVTGAATLVGAIGGTSPIRGLSTAITPKISINDASVSEGNSGSTQMVFNVTLSHPAAVIVQLRFETANDSAESVADYIPLSGLLTFALGETTKTITIAVNGEAKIEADEAFKVVLTNAINAVFLDSEAIGAILNDDQDTDGDGVANTVDNCPNAANSTQTDSNSNGIGDACEPTACGACGPGASTMLALMVPALLIYRSTRRRRLEI